MNSAHGFTEGADVPEGGSEGQGRKPEITPSEYRHMVQVVVYDKKIDVTCQRCGTHNVISLPIPIPVRPQEQEDLFAELCKYVGNHQYGKGYEFNFQMWAGMWTIFINKDDVELTSMSGDNAEQVLTQALDYLKRIKAKKPTPKR